MSGGLSTSNTTNAEGFLNGQRWSRYLTQRVAGAIPDDVDPIALFDLKKNATFDEFNQKFDSVRKLLVFYHEKREGRAYDRTLLNNETAQAIAFLDDIKGQYTTTKIWDDYLNKEANVANFGKLIRYKPEQLDFRPGRDNPLAVLGIKGDFKELSAMLMSPTARQEITTLRDTVLEEFEEYRGVVTTPHFDRYVKRINDAAEYVLKDPKICIIELRKIENSAQEFESSGIGSHTLDKSSPYGIFKALGLPLRVGNKLIELDDFNKRLDTLDETIEDLEWIGNRSNQLKMAKENAAHFRATWGNHSGLQSLKEGFIAFATATETEISKRLKNAAASSEFAALAAFNNYPDADGVWIERTVALWNSDQELLNDPRIRSVIGDSRCKTFLNTLKGYFNEALEEEIGTSGKTSYKMKTSYIKEENKKRDIRIDREVDAMIIGEEIKFKSKFIPGDIFNNPRAVVNAQKWVVPTLIGASVASVAGLLVFGPGFVNVTGTTTVLNIALTSIAGSSGLALGVAYWVGKLGRNRYDELIQTNFLNKLYEVTQSVKEPEELPPILLDAAKYLLLYQNKLPIEVKRQILREMFRSEPLFQHVTSTEDITPRLKERDTALLRMKAATLGFKHNGLSETERGITPEEAATIESEEKKSKIDEPTFFKSLCDGFKSLEDSRKNMKQARKYYYPDRLAKFYPDGFGMSVNEDVFIGIDTAYKILRFLSIAHAEQGILQRDSLLNRGKTETKEFLTRLMGYSGLNDISVPSIGTKLWMAESNSIFGPAGQLTAMEFWRNKIATYGGRSGSN